MEYKIHGVIIYDVKLIIIGIIFKSLIGIFIRGLKLSMFKNEFNYNSISGNISEMNIIKNI